MKCCEILNVQSHKGMAQHVMVCSPFNGSHGDQEHSQGSPTSGTKSGWHSQIVRLAFLGNLLGSLLILEFSDKLTHQPPHLFQFLGLLEGVWGRWCGVHRAGGDFCPCLLFGT